MMSAGNSVAGSDLAQQQQQRQQHSNEEFMPGDNIAQFYIFFGIALIVPYSFFVILWNEPSSLGLFAYHPPILALALSALAYGISPLQPARHPDTTAAALDIHGLFMGLISLPLFVIGASVMWQQKENSGTEHFATWHGTFGALGATFVLFQALVGFALGAGYLPKAFKRYHRLSGYLLVTSLSFTVMVGGLSSKFVTTHSWAATQFLVYGVGPVSIAGGVLSRVRRRKLGV